MNFEWNPQKAERNLKKHSVSFQEAASVFRSELSDTVYDPDHSDDEDRFITIGWSSQNRLLIVSHTERGDTIRIISSRKLTKSERKAYEEERR